jgi:hypothetical protein
MAPSRNKPLESVLDTAIQDCDDDKVTIGALLDMFGDRSFGPVIILLGLLVTVPPLGGIPGLPILVGIIILLFSLQIVFGARHIWMPQFVQKQGIACSKLEDARGRVRPWLQRIDRMITERLTWATGRIATYAAALAVSGLSLLMIPLELVPFAVAAPGTAIVLFGLALVARDGALMLAGFAGTAAAFSITVFLVPWSVVAGWF